MAKVVSGEYEAMNSRIQLRFDGMLQQCHNGLSSDQSFPVNFDNPLIEL